MPTHFTLHDVEMFYSDQTYFLRFYVAIKTFKNSKHSKNNFYSLTGTATSCSGFMQRKQYSGN